MTKYNKDNNFYTPMHSPDIILISSVIYYLSDTATGFWLLYRSSIMVTILAVGFVSGLVNCIYFDICVTDDH